MNQRRSVVVFTDQAIHVLALEGRGATVTQHRVLDCALPRSLYAEHDAEAIAEAVRQALQDISAPTAMRTLVLPLSWCFFHVLERAGQRRTERALSFALEQYLPVPLEELTCTFVPLSEGHVLALAIPTAPMQRLIQAFGTRGMDVDATRVDIPALMDHDSSSQPLTAGWILIDRETVRFGGRSVDGEPCVGFVDLEAPEPTPSLKERLKQRGIEDVAGWTTLTLHRESCSDDTAAPHEQANDRGDAVEVVARAALGSGSGDLRTAALAYAGRWDAARTTAQHCAVLLAACLAIVVVGLQARIRAADVALQGVFTEQSAIYGEVFAGQPAPPNAPMRLASERIRLEALTRRQVLPTSAPSPPLDVFREFVTQLPADVRVSLQEARIDNKQVLLRGVTAEHRDAERIAEAVRRVAGLDGRPPRTRRIDSGGVEFSIAATWFSEVSPKRQP